MKLSTFHKRRRRKFKPKSRNIKPDIYNYMIPKLGSSFINVFALHNRKSFELKESEYRAGMQTISSNEETATLLIGLFFPRIHTETNDDRTYTHTFMPTMPEDEILNAGILED